jgi:hypothetical protein
VADLDHFLVQRRDRASGVIHEYHLVAYVFGTHRDAMLAAHPPTEGAGRQWWLKRAIIWLAATAALWWWVSFPIRDGGDCPRLVTGAERGVKRELFKVRCKQLWQAAWAHDYARLSPHSHSSNT